MAASPSELSYGSLEVHHDLVLGVGTYGKVYKARYGQLPCAAKLLHETMFEGGDAGSFITGRFEQECQFLSVIKHPNIVLYLGHSRDSPSGRLALLMELMDESLTIFLKRSTGFVPYHIQLNICHDVALALSYLHSNSFIHRDLSSNNVLLIGEGIRAKITDFGMSKLTDMNPRMTQLTQCPGTAVYMPPEALTSSPHYSHQLDCFSHGVLTIQIVTKNFPRPGDANKYIEDPKYPTGHVLVPFPEAERRKRDIDLIEPDHPLLPIALHCIKDRDTERPSADEVCERLVSLKREGRYAHSVEQTRDQQASLIHTPQGEMDAGKDQLVQRLQEKLQHVETLLQKERADHGKELAAKDEIIKQTIDDCYQRLREEDELEATGNFPDSGSLMASTSFESSMSSSSLVNPMKLTSRQGEPAPQHFTCRRGTAIVYDNAAYFSNFFDLYSFTLSDNRWIKLQQCKYKYFSMAVINNTLTTIGGRTHMDRSRNPETNILLSLTPGDLNISVWKEVFPPMPTRRRKSASLTINTSLVVAGGKVKNEDVFEVEVLDTERMQWSKVTSIPSSLKDPWLTLCGGHIYLRQGNVLHSCAADQLLELQATPSTNTSDVGSVWTRLADIPVQFHASLTNLKEHVLTIGGSDTKLGWQTSSAIRCYHRATNSWSVIGQLPTPRHSVLTAVLPSNEMIVVGGWTKVTSNCSTCIITLEE